MITIMGRGRGGVLGLLVALLLVPSLSGSSRAADSEWPKKFVHPEASIVLYQPQLETFKEDKLTARSAVSVQKKDEKVPVFGVVWFSARVATDRDTRMATIQGVQATNVKFADAKPEQEEKLRVFLENEVKDWEYTLSLDRIVAAMDKVQEAMRADAGLNTEPPKILFVTHPAVLVPVDGDPKLLPLPSSKLMRVGNTPFLLVYEPEGKSYYLRGGDEWLAATELKGPWNIPGTIPSDVDAMWKEIEKQTGEAGAKRGGPRKVEAVAGKMPQIIVATEPTELLATEGEPQYTPIQGTDLLYVSNTEDNIFLYSKTQEYIVLISGRWFKSKSLTEGPWTYVSSNSLPADFAKIPEGSVKGFVLVNVAGTSQAAEAIHEMYIPQTAAIDRTKATVQVSYDGDPQWERIPNTDLDYAVNTAQTVFRQGANYYALEQGVWYEAASATGPWKVCVSPPEKVNDIPPSNPRYNAKYVKVYDSTESTAYVGYTPGYTGSYVQDGAVVYGTGYRYPGYATPTTYVAYPATYGYSAVYDPYAATWGYQPAYYNPYAWLGAAITTAAVVGLTWAVWDNFWDHHHHHRWYGGGYWGAGGYRYRNVGYYHNRVVHRNWGPGRPGWNRPGWDRPGRPGWGGPGGRPGGPTTLPAVRPGGRPGLGAEQRPNLYNRPWNQANLSQRPGRPGARPGDVRPGGAEGRPGQIGARPGQLPASRPGGGEGLARPTKQPARGKAGQNNVFSDKDGNVFRKTDKGWQQREGGKWSPAAAQRPGRSEGVSRAGSRPQVSTRERPSRDIDTNSLNRDFNQRQRGDVRSNRFERSNAASAVSRPGGGGRGRAESVGGARGGGGGGGARMGRGGGGGGGGGGGNRGGGGGGGRGGGGRGGGRGR
ncbi:MAG: hypothetical protein AB9873_06155 [Syntrophobacteraceae bacterium]